jgi:hypothetical protein
MYIKEERRPELDGEVTNMHPDACRGARFLAKRVITVPVVSDLCGQGAGVE